MKLPPIALIMERKNDKVFHELRGESSSEVCWDFGWERGVRLLDGYHIKFDLMHN